jgi:hypothetical protein
MVKSKCSSKPLYKYFEDIGLPLTKKKKYKNKSKKSNKKKKIKSTKSSKKTQRKIKRKTKSRKILYMPARYSYYM